MTRPSSSKPRTIGVLSPYLGGFYFGEGMVALHRAARLAGVQLLSIRSGRRRPLSIPLALDQVDAWIIWTDLVTPRHLADILASGKPVVSLAHDFRLPQILSIQSDNRGAVIEATNFLITKGHRDIVFSGFRDEFDQNERRHGFQTALSRHGLPIRPAYDILLDEAGYSGGLTLAKRLLATALPFTAVIAATDLIAAGLMKALKDAGLRVPEDVAIIGYDNLPLSRTTMPALATVDQNHAEMASTAISAACQQIESGQRLRGTRLVRNVFLPRASCGATAQETSAHTVPHPVDADAHANDIGIGYEITKDLISADYSTVLRRMWVLAPYIEWACIGEWQDFAAHADRLVIRDVFDLQETGQHPLLDTSIRIAAFPPLEHLPQEPAAGDRFVTLLPVIFEKRWTVLAVTALFSDDASLVRYPTLMHYLDLLGLALERSMVDEEVHGRELRTRESEHKFSSIFNLSPIPLSLIKETDATFVDVNNAWLAQFGLSRQEVIGRDSAELNLWVDLTERKTLFANLLSHKVINQYECRQRSKDGREMICVLSIQPFRTDHTTCYIIASFNVTRQREVEREILRMNSDLEERVRLRTLSLEQSNAELAQTLESLERATDELIRSEKMAALGSLVAGVAHELNTPIGNSVLVASTLNDQTRHFRAEVDAGKVMRSSLTRYLDDANAGTALLLRSLHTAHELISGFKQVAVDQTSALRRRFDLAHTVEEVLVTLMPMIRKTPYTLALELESGIQLDSYPGPLGQIITNLIANALAHAFEGRSTGTMKLIAKKLGSTRAEIIFIDDGVGIPDAHRNRVFDPFFTTKFGQGGSGLGLHIVYNLVTAILGGSIDLRSQPGQGTAMVLRLPLSAPSDGDSHQPTQPIALHQ